MDDYLNSEVALAQSQHLRLRHSVNTVTRINETLDFFLSELEIIKGELRQYHAEKMNQNTYLFSVIAAIFLPTSFLTGLLGVNVGGIPGTESPIAFGLFCAGLGLIFGLEFWILRRLRFLIINRKSLQELIMYIFGYGSLINSASRRLTYQTDELFPPAQPDWCAILAKSMTVTFFHP